MDKIGEIAMEIKINKEIRHYKENIFFGLSLRQFIFSLLACIIAVIIYFTFKPIIDNTEIVSWLCIIASVPFVLLGFVKYNGMTSDKFFIAWIKSKILTPKKLVFKPNNLYFNIYMQCEKDKIKNKKGEEYV